MASRPQKRPLRNGAKPNPAGISDGVRARRPGGAPTAPAARPERRQRHEPDFRTTADVRKHFSPLIKHAWETGKRVYTEDKSGAVFMTIDPKKRHVGPDIPAGAQFVRDNFSSVCRLVRVGMVLKVPVPKCDGFVYLRRHTDYSNPCDPLIGKWQHALAAATAVGAVAEAEGRLVGLIGTNDRRQDGRHEEVQDLLKVVKLGIARLAIGHKPFEEGRIGDDTPPPGGIGTP